MRGFKMKKILSFLLVSILALTCTVGHCTHVHDENCGYNPETGEGCTHVCEYVDPQNDKNPYD